MEMDFFLQKRLRAKKIYNIRKVIGMNIGTTDGRRPLYSMSSPTRRGKNSRLQ